VDIYVCLPVLEIVPIKLTRLRGRTVASGSIPAVQGTVPGRGAPHSPFSCFSPLAYQRPDNPSLAVGKLLAGAMRKERNEAFPSPLIPFPFPPILTLRSFSLYRRLPIVLPCLAFLPHLSLLSAAFLFSSFRFSFWFLSYVVAARRQRHCCASLIPSCVVCERERSASCSTWTAKVGRLSRPQSFLSRLLVDRVRASADYCSRPARPCTPSLFILPSDLDAFLLPPELFEVAC
jgi:hypothetical protein